MIEITEMGGAGAWLGVITSARHAASHHNQGSVAGADTQNQVSATDKIPAFAPCGRLTW